MIMAELHGKLSEEASSLEAREDILTSNVFQCLRYLEPEYGLVPILNAIFKDNHIPKNLDPLNYWNIEYFFWPVGTRKKREPDLLICLKSESEKYAIVIEAKFHSGPSNKEEIDEETQKEFGNQLSDEFIDLLERRYKFGGKIIDLDCSLDNCFLLYLTMNNIRPKYDISTATDQYQKNYPSSKISIKAHLMWTNWTKIWSVLRSKKIDVFPQNLVRNDLLSLLERKGFKEFSGFSLEYWEENYRSFYKEIWFHFHLKFYDRQNANFYSE